MFLSRLILDPRSRQVRRDLADCYQLHRTVLSAFPQVDGGGLDARAQAGVLFRLDDRPQGDLVLLVQSRTQPDWSRLPDSYLAVVDPFAGAVEPNPAVREIGHQYADFPADLQLGFRLRANPTRKINTKTGGDGKPRNGRRVPVIGDKKLLAWLDRKAQQHGFSVIGAQIGIGLNPVEQVRTSHEGRVRGNNDGRPLTFQGVTFEGALRIEDAKRFHAALAGGIGSGKAFGFGLLSIAKLPR